MVREFTELQGVMGGIYAREAREPEAVWRAIYHHYLPISAESGAAPKPEQLGAARATWASVSLADKLDTLVGLFLAGERPTGSRDPFGLRRQTHGILKILIDGEALTGRRITTPVWTLVRSAAAGYEGKTLDDAEADLRAFVIERLQFTLESRGYDRRNVRAVLASTDRLETTAVADLEQNLDALREFARSEPFRKLAEAFKRVRNIARELPDTAGEGPPLRASLTEPAEVALLDEIERREGPIQAAATGGGTFRAAYAEAAAFEPAVARFFTEVFVMADDAVLRDARLRLMRRLERLILQLGDISEIVAE